ncbi:hypothetical protein QC764_506510 [Podospora pseudoanserina]|uniref:Uncharacterized protein n=1 Tax=Podospora pseudoanserina TaxID=2609844 RepID=A0ABR0I6X4_9PEZI|nr:hypothetical protein QC764_506510 [Podospora pseudoanserina]
MASYLESKPGFIGLPQNFLRAVGLGIFTKLVQRPEPPKLLIRKSRRVALARSAVHILPATISIILIYINLSGRFIGSELEGPQGKDSLKMALLQVAAKLQELLVVGSMGTIIFHIIRQRLFSNDGIPLGLLVSGWSFSQLSYFYSGEFWSGVLSLFQPPSGRLRSLALVLLLLLSGILALMAGPAAAIIMIPRIMDLPVGGSVFWLNGTEKDLWPSILDGSYLADYDCSTPDKQLYDPACPSSNFLPLHQHYSNAPLKFETELIQLEMVDPKIRKAVYFTVRQGPGVIDTWFYTAHASTAAMQDALRDLHMKALLFLKYRVGHFGRHRPGSLERAVSKRYEVETKSSLTRTVCRPLPDLSFETVKTLMFPPVKLEEKFGDKADGYWEVDVEKPVREYLGRRRILMQEGDGTWRLNPEPNTVPSIIAIPVPLDQDESFKFGLLVTRRQGESNVWWPATCTLDARWGDARSFFEFGDRSMRFHDFHRGKVSNLVQTTLETTNGDNMLSPYYNPPNDHTITPIALHLSWYDHLSPVIPAGFIPDHPDSPLRGTNRSTLEALLETIPAHNWSPQNDVVGIDTEGLELVISMTFVDGLSRCGIALNPNSGMLLGGTWEKGALEKGTRWEINNDKPDDVWRLFKLGEPIEVFAPPASLDLERSTRMVMRVTFTGYMMAADNWFDYLCVAAMMVHALAALIHTVWVVWHAETSEAWDSIPEMIGLAQRSPPPCEEEACLDNIGAGIASVRNLGEVAWVEVHDDSGYGSQDGVRLRFGDGVRTRDPKWVPKAEERYS